MSSGREGVPSIAQLSSPTGEAWAYTLLVIGVLALSGALFYGNAVGIRVAGWVLAAGALVFAATVARVMHHDLSGPKAQWRQPRSRS